jgi:monoamine oxidase
MICVDGATDTPLDVAIVGGGLCGLALANSLGAKGLSLAVYEARDRLGGRIFSPRAANNGLALDMGPPGSGRPTNREFTDCWAISSWPVFLNMIRAGFRNWSTRMAPPASSRSMICTTARGALRAVRAA